jgi:hypothetical protein
MTVRFDTALRALLEWLPSNTDLFPQGELVIVRDLRGQIRLIAESTEPATWHSAHEAEMTELLGSYKAGGQFLIRLGRDQGFDSFFTAPDAYTYDGLPDTWRILDRLVTGREWLYPANAPSSHPPRFVFYGLKGGVGRSTALSMVAWHLAQQGKKVLVIDLDLESPGLGNMLLPVRQELGEEGDTALPGWPDFGLTDWFVEDAVGQADADLVRAMIQPSPMPVSGRGEIFVVPAAGGLYQQDYVSKLSRVYADLPNREGTPEVFGDRLARAIAQLEQQVKPDVVLLDSRAGIHHISAVALTRLDAFSYLFASNSAQTWAGYKALFSHWAIKLQTIKRVRTSLRLVSALTPAAEDKDTFRDTFGEHAFDTFFSLYDEEPSQEHPANESSNEPLPELFSFGPFEKGAPHRPICIWHERVYGSFSPLTQALQLDAENAQRAFGELFASLDSDIERALQLETRA